MNVKKEEFTEQFLNEIYNNPSLLELLKDRFVGLNKLTERMDKNDTRNHRYYILDQALSAVFTFLVSATAIPAGFLLKDLINFEIFLSLNSKQEQGGYIALVVLLALVVCFGVKNLIEGIISQEDVVDENKRKATHNRERKSVEEARKMVGFFLDQEGVAPKNIHEALTSQLFSPKAS